jgi:hypothetical protein
MDKVLRACLNWKVIGGLTATGVGIWFLAPHLLAVAFPFLFVAVCPLSMLLMMRGMSPGRSPAAREPKIGKPVGVGVEPESVDDLRARLDEAEREQKALSQEIDEREAATGREAARGEQQPSAR